MAINKGPRGLSVGRCGVTHSNLISALQKYCRRGEVAKAVRVAVELDLFREFDQLDGQTGAVIVSDTGARIRSNMINRIAIIAMEDIGPANPALLPQIEKLRAAWMARRDKPIDSKENPGIPLVAAVTAMARSAKSRLASHARAAYSFNSPESVDAAKAAGIARPREADYPTVGIKVKGESADVDALQQRLDSALANRSDEAIYWADKLNNCDLKVARDRSKKGSAAVWQSIRRTTPPEVLPAVETLYTWHRELSGCREDFCFAVCAILIINPRYRPKPAAATTAATTAAKTAAITKTAATTAAKTAANTAASSAIGAAASTATAAGIVTAAVAELYRVCPPLVLDDYCIDKHTPEGRRAGKDTKHFVQVSSHVENQSPTAWNQAYYDIYTELRIGLRESDLVTGPVRCQLVTSAAKTCTYLADTTPAGQRRFGMSKVFVKGPLSPAAVAGQLVADSIKARLAGMAAVGLTRMTVIPDLFPNGTALGRRRVAMGTKGDETRHQFLVGPNLFRANGADGPLPTKMVESKLWKPTAVYDQEKDDVATAKHTNLESPTPSQTLVLCFRYIFGIGDTCARNILDVQSDDGKIVSVSLDEETPFREYAPPRFGEAKQAAIVKKITYWDKIVETFTQWPDNLNGCDAQMAAARAFIEPRIEALIEAGPAALYRCAAL